MTDDLVRHLEGQLAERQADLAAAVARIETCRALLTEARRAATSLPAGRGLSVDDFLQVTDDVVATTRRYLIVQYEGSNR